MGFKRDLDKITSYLSLTQKGTGGSNNAPEVHIYMYLYKFMDDYIH
jgi:hypothetical protein